MIKYYGLFDEIMLRYYDRYKKGITKEMTIKNRGVSEDDLVL